MKKFLLSLFAVLTATFAVAQTNLLTNASFEEWSEGYPVDWKSTTSASTTATVLQSTDAHEGAYAVEIKSVASSNKRLASKEFELEAGTYTFSIWMKSAGEASVAKMGYAYMDGNSMKYVYCMNAEGKEIEYSLTSEYVECSGTFTLETATTVNIVVMNNKKSNAISIIADDASLIASEGGGEEPEPGVDISNTAETAYTVSRAIELIDAGQGLSTQVYVKGEVAEVTEVSVANGNATYVITDGEKTLTVFRGKYLQQKNFTNADQIQDGDEVIVFGKLTLYTNQKEGTSTYELAQGNYLYSLNGQTEAEEEPTPEPSAAITVAQAHELAANATALIEGATVYALCKNGAVFGDATGYIYYYNTATSGLTVGDIVTISGAVSKYNGFNQFTNTATITKTGTASAIEYPDAADIDLDAWVASPAIQFVKLTGTLKISNNKYYNIVVEGKTAQGSIVGSVADMFSGIESGNTITVEGFAMYPSGSSTKYVNIVATKVSKDEEGGGEEGGGDTPEPVVDGDNLLTNGSFEQWTDGIPVDWQSTNSASTSTTMAQSTDAHTGSYAVEIKGISSANKRLASKEITLEAGTYTFSTYVKGATENAATRLGYAVTKADGSLDYNWLGSGPVTLGTEYTQLSESFTLEATTTVNMLVMNNKSGAGVSVICDDVSLVSDGEEPVSGEDITNTPENAYTVSEAINFINNKEAYDLSKQVYVKGEVTEVTEVSIANGNATYVIADEAGATLTIFRGKYLQQKNFTNADQIQDGDEVVVFGKLMLYEKEGQDPQYQMDKGNYLYSKNGQTEAEEEPTPDYSETEAISIADFLQKADTQNMYKLTGVVRNLTNTTYGNFYLCDQENEETKIYIYGVVKADDLTNNKIWSSLEVSEGDILTLVGTYTTFNNSPQIAKAIYISHEKGQEPPVDITNTPETAYTVAEANNLITAGKGLAAKVYVKGIISEIKSYNPAKYKRAQYYISEDGTTENQFLIYNGYYLEGKDFTRDEQIKVGDKVIVYGQLVNYNGTYEMAQDNFIYSLNGITDGIRSIDNEKLTKDGVIYDLSGRRVEKPVKGLYIVNGKKVVF